MTQSRAFGISLLLCLVSQKVCVLVHLFKMVINLMKRGGFLSTLVAAGLCVRRVIDGDRLTSSGQFKN